MTDEEKEEWAKLENALDFVPKIHFWVNKYDQSTGVDHIKALVRRICCL